MKKTIVFLLLAAMLFSLPACSCPKPVGEQGAGNKPAESSALPAGSADPSGQAETSSPADTATPEPIVTEGPTSEPTPEPTPGPALYAAVVGDLESHWGVGTIAASTAEEFGRDYQFSGVAVLDLLDMDGDGVDELLVGYSRGSGDGIDPRTEVWAIRDGAPVKLFSGETYGESSYGEFEIVVSDVKGKKYLVLGVSGESTFIDIYGVENREFRKVHSFVADDHYDSSSENWVFEYLFDGTVCSYDEFSDLLNRWVWGSLYLRCAFLYYDSESANSERILARTQEVRAILGLG